jgi:chromosome partitioning protein
LGARSKETTKNILQSVEYLGTALRKHLKATKSLLDTSPFFGGATHLGWVAADALVIPVRVDQHSMEALKLTLSMLKNHEMDFIRLNKQAGITKLPKVHAIVMTHCGWNRQTALTPDRSTQAYLAQVIDIAKAMPSFSHATIQSTQFICWMIFILLDALAARSESRWLNSTLGTRTRSRGSD